MVILRYSALSVDELLLHTCGGGGVTEFTSKADKQQSSTIGVMGIFLDEPSSPAGDSTHRA